MSAEPKGLLSFFSSTTGKKYLTGATGLALVIFSIAHLLGNLSLLLPDASVFNIYAKTLHDLGPVLYMAEFGLLAFFVIHVGIGISIYLTKRKARPIDYDSYKSAGGPSKQSLSSRTMLWTGMVLLIFIVLHLWTFKFGPGMSEGYITTVGGQPARDLHRLVIEIFKQPIYVIAYTFVMVLMAFHLRHGIWSALTSLTLLKPRSSKFIYSTALVIGLLIALGFLLLPIWLYFMGSVPTRLVLVPATLPLLFTSIQKERTCHHLG